MPPDGPTAALEFGVSLDQRLTLRLDKPLGDRGRIRLEAAHSPQEGWRASLLGRYTF